MTSFEIREKFLKYFQTEQHLILPGSSLIPKKDPSLLFVNAGMNQFKDVFLGLNPPPADNVATIQKCLRAGGKHNDLETVGKSPTHHTFFEMLGNFSFGGKGGYSKERAIELAWAFLTEALGFSPEELYVTVYHKDKESYRIWSERQKIPESRIYLMDEKDNFWQMEKNSGPCGPCTEIHYFKGKSAHPSKFIEVWNLVFMEFYDSPGKERKKLPQACVDTGMGLERLAALLQNKKSNYHTDLFKGIILSLEEASGCKYDFKEKTQTERQKAFRALADHSRATAFLISEGVYPGSQGAEYVLRRIMRRALYYSQKLNPEENLLLQGATITTELMAQPPSSPSSASPPVSPSASSSALRLKRSSTPSFTALQLGYSPSLKQEEKLIQFYIKSEAEQFFETLREGKKKLYQMIQSSSKPRLSAQAVWTLYSSYGFPMDLTQLIAAEKGFSTATEQEAREYGAFFEEKQRGQKREQTKANGEGQKEEDLIKSMVDSLSSLQRSTIWTAYEKDKEEGVILALKFLDKKPEGRVGARGLLILDKTCFYPEGGGPIGDQGLLITQTGRAKVLDCQKKGECIFHKIEILSGTLELAQGCKMEVDQKSRANIASAHTATHLLNSALRKSFGNTLRQAGSLVEPSRLRFDFTYPRPIEKKLLRELEDKIWQSIEREEPVSSSYKSFKQAEREGAVFLKEEQYHSKEVRVISIGQNTSMELCGGIHVRNTKEIESFKIINERAVQAGVRRISAYTGSLALKWESFLIQQNKSLRDYLKAKLFKTDGLVLNLPLSQKQPIDQKQPIAKAPEELLFTKEGFFWKGRLEKQNPFIRQIEELEGQLKKLRKQIIQLEPVEPKSQTVDKSLGANNSDKAKAQYLSIKSRFHPLALQAEDFALSLSLPLPDEKYFMKQPELSPLIREEFSFRKPFQEKARLLSQREDQWNSLKQMGDSASAGINLREFFVKKSKAFSIGGESGRLLCLRLPLEDRKILADISDTLLKELSSGLIVLLGESGESSRGEGEKFPILVSLSKNFDGKLSAKKILKEIIAPLCKGQGGGKVLFAQGSIKAAHAFPQVEKTLINQWSLKN